MIERVAEKIIRAKSPVILAGRANDSSIEGVSTVKAAYFLNEVLGNRPRIDFSQYHALSNTSYRSDIHKTLASLTTDNVVILHNTNPVYSEPGFAGYLKKASAVIYIGSVANETSAIANFVLPSHYPLEVWGDYEPWKSTISLMQPVMKPLYDSKSAGDIFMEFSGKVPGSGTFKDLVRKEQEMNGSLK